MPDFDLTTIKPRVVEAWEIEFEPPSTRRVPATVTRYGAAAIALAAGVAAAFGSLEPTGYETIDLAWRVGLAVVATLAASTARRWSLMWLAAVALATSSSSFELACGAVSAVIAVISMQLNRHNRIAGALVGAFGIQSIVRPPSGGWSLFFGLLVVAAVVPVCYSAYRLLRRRHRRRVRQVVLLGVVAAIGAGAVAALSVGVASRDMQDAVDAMRVGLADIDEGDDPEAQVAFAEAESMFDDAITFVDAPWTMPALALPVVSQHLTAAQSLAASGADLATAAESVAGGANYRDLRLAEGTISIRQLELIAPIVDDAAEALDAADARMAATDGEWLVPPLADAVATLEEEIADVRPETLLAAEALDALPGILGSEGDRRYLVAVTSPNETRNSGGFMGGYAEITAVEGTIEKVAAGSITDLNTASDPGARTLEMNEEFFQRYGTYQPARFLQNATVSPDLPTTARVLARLYPQAGGAPLNGAAIIDPIGLAALLELTGPITVEGVGRPLDAQSVVPFLLSEQYIEFPDNTDRDEIQANVAEATFDALLSASLPGPRRIGEVLGPVVEAGHIGFWTFDEDEQAFLDEVGTSDRFVPGDDDFLSVRVANAAPNKLDAYLEREIGYDIDIDPETGTYRGEVTVTLTNAAPEGLSEYVAGTRESREGRATAPPLGTNRLFVTTYSNSTVRGATIDGAPVPLGVQDELGTRAHTTRVDIPRDGQVTISYQVEGTYDDGIYRLRLSNQPLARPDVVTFDVSVPDGYSAEVRGDATDVSRQTNDIVVEVLDD